MGLIKFTFSHKIRRKDPGCGAWVGWGWGGCMWLPAPWCGARTGNAKRETGNGYGQCYCLHTDEACLAKHHRLHTPKPSHSIPWRHRLTALASQSLIDAWRCTIYHGSPHSRQWTQHMMHTLHFLPALQTTYNSLDFKLTLQTKIIIMVLDSQTTFCPDIFRNQYSLFLISPVHLWWLSMHVLEFPLKSIKT